MLYLQLYFQSMQLDLSLSPVTAAKWGKQLCTAGLPGSLQALQQGLCGLGPQTHQGPPALLAAADSAVAGLPLHTNLPLRKQQARGPWFGLGAGASFIWLYSLACKTPSFEQQSKVVFPPRDLF